jgi:gamma-glutamyl hercynylcysteine S-oxide synthase
MLKSAFAAFVALVVLFGLNACGKKEKQGKSVPEQVKPAIVPGEMVLIPAGEFFMGTDSTAQEAWYSNPRHKRILPAFRIDKYEVTNLQYMEFTSKTGYVGEGEKEGKDWRLYFTPDKEQFPVLYISWKDADTYCKSVGKRLPTEEEWEKAARGPNGNLYPWGNEWVSGRSNTSEAGLKIPSSIGQFDDVSFYGVHDMLGNVQEWTSSLFPFYPGNPHSDALDPRKNNPNFKEPKLSEKPRSVRGLSARISGRKGGLWNRSGHPPGLLADTGFRCAKDN